MTAQSLRSRSIKDLADMARRRGVDGWHSMRKDQLIHALLQPVAKRTAPVSRSAAKKTVTPVRSAVSKNGAPNRSAAMRNGSLRNGSLHRNGASPVAGGTVTRTSSSPVRPTKPIRRAPIDPRLARRLEQAKLRLNQAKSISTEQLDGREGAPVKDRLVVMVRGPYWLHAYWELTPAGIIRAQAALGEQWHSAKPMLRLVHVSSPGGSTSAERVLRDIPIHGGVKNWYVDVLNPPQTYRMEIGYLAANGRFFSLARSNTVTTPASGSSEKLDQHWTDVVENCDTIYAMSGGYSTESNSSELQEVLQDRLRRRVGGSLSDRYQAGVESLLPKDRSVRFHVEAEMLVHGTTHPDAQVTLQGAPIKLRPDGSFSVRLDLPNRRQVLPLVATSKDGASQRTVVLAVERNTKVMEPLNREPNLD